MSAGHHMQANADAVSFQQNFEDMGNGIEENSNYD
jgi:hypothetical protein